MHVQDIMARVMCQAHALHRKSNMKHHGNKKLIYGNGINDADYVVCPKIYGKRIFCPHYRAWTNMIGRCFSAAWHKKYPTYLGCTIDQSWLSFMTFRAWMVTQDWEGNQLDKDIMIVGNKHYGPETCAFVSSQVNNLILINDASRGDLSLGVCYNHGRYQSALRIYGKIKHLGLFDTETEAATVYNAAKATHIRDVAHRQTDPRICAGLLRHAELYASGAI